MTRAEVDHMLEAYRFDYGRCAHLRVERDRLKAALEVARYRLAQDIAAPQSPVITDMPRGTTVGNPTERMGLRLASGATSPEIEELEAKLNDIERELQQRSVTVDYVNAWMCGLPERERWLVSQQVIDQSVWRDVCMAYRQRYSDVDITKDRLRRMRHKALDSIYRMAGASA